MAGEQEPILSCLNRRKRAGLTYMLCYHSVTRIGILGTSARTSPL